MPRESRTIKTGFPPIAAPDARLLILGTLPGDESLRLRQYYGHKHNAFWRLVAGVFGENVPENYTERPKLLIRNRCALWDVLHAAERVGSSDAAIRNASANAFAPFFDKHRMLDAIAFNGQKARELFKRHVLKMGVELPANLDLIDLPSSSSLHTMAFEHKEALWNAALRSFKAK